MAETKNDNKPTGNSVLLRIGSILLWILAICCDFLAVLLCFGKFKIIPNRSELLFIPALILDLVFVIFGSQFWKKANRLKPASKKNPAAFWIWNNIALVITVFAFIPFIILPLKNKNLDGKTKLVSGIAALLSIAISVLLVVLL